MGENERIHPLSCSLSWEHHTGMCPFPTREDRLFSRAAPANTTASWPNTKAKPKECQPNTADMEAHFPVPNLCDSICPHSSIQRKELLPGDSGASCEPGNRGRTLPRGSL